MRHERVEYDRASLAGDPEYRTAVQKLAIEISREIDSQARARLAAHLEQRPSLRGLLDPHRSSVIIEVLVVFLAAGGAAVFLTRSGVDLDIAAPVSALFNLVASTLMAVVVLRGLRRGMTPPFTNRVTVLVIATTLPGLVLAAVTGTLTDPRFAVWWGILGLSAAVAVVLLILLLQNWRAIGVDGRMRIAADLDAWVEVVRAAHQATLQDAAARLAALWASVPASRRRAVEDDRAAAVGLLVERGLVEQADALRNAVPGALELDLVIRASTSAWGSGAKTMTAATIVPVIDDRAGAA